MEGDEVDFQEMRGSFHSLGEFIFSRFVFRFVRCYFHVAIIRSLLFIKIILDDIATRYFLFIIYNLQCVVLVRLLVIMR